MQVGRVNLENVAREEINYIENLGGRTSLEGPLNAVLACHMNSKFVH